jgi:hypothetical protein
VTLCLGLVAMAAFAFGPAGMWLARATWPERAPRAAIALWQALGVAGALAAVGAGLALAVSTLHRGLVAGTIALLAGATRGRPLAVPGMDEAFGLTLAATVVAVLVVGMVLTALRSFSARRRHRILLDLVARQSELAPGACSSTTHGPPPTACPGSGPASWSVPAPWTCSTTLNWPLSWPTSGDMSTNGTTWCSCPSPP